MDSLTDLATRADGVASPTDAAPAGVVAEARPETGAAEDAHKLVPGQRWQKFLIGAAVPGAGGRVFFAENASQMEKVVIAVTPVTEATVWRRGAWDRLKMLPSHARVIAGVDAIEEDGWRYEISLAPQHGSLREWIACNKAGAEAVQNLLQQVTGTLSALHAQGVVHLNIRPETIFVEEGKEDMRVWLGGMHMATLYTQPSIKLESVDPFYAPPEASDTKEFPPGTALCSWDWWSIGRVVQEFMLGKHVMNMLFNADITKPTPELLAKALRLLQERDPSLPRAGAVEKMADISPTVVTLLSGLLTAARDARWGQDAVQRWLKGEKVRHHYHLARDARLFLWKGRSFTLEEAVEYFSTDENWLVGEEHILDEEKADKLSFFIGQDKLHPLPYERLQKARALLQLPAWQKLPPPLRRNLAASAAWLVLGGPSAKKNFRLKNAAIDKTTLAARLLKPEVASGLDIVIAITTEPFIRLIETADATTAALLDRAARLSSRALALASGHKWFEAAERNLVARVLAISLEPDVWLKGKATKVRETYAACRDPQLFRLLEKPDAEPAEQVVAIVTAEFAARFEYITMAEWKRQNAARLVLRSQRLHAAIFWTRLSRVLAFGNLWAARQRVFFTVLAGIVAVGLGLARDPLVTGLLILVLLAGRLGLTLQLRRLAKLHDPEASPWTWVDGVPRCRAELQRLDPGAPPRSIEELEKALAASEAEAAAQLSKPPMGTRPAFHLQPISATLASACAAVVVLGSQFGLGTTLAPLTAGLPDKPVWRHRVTRVMPADLNDVKRLLPEISPEMAEKVLAGEYEIMNDGFGLQLNGPLQKWSFVPPAVPDTLPVAARKPSTPNERAWAQVSGGLLLKSFGHGPINALVAVKVPTPNGDELMIYNGRDHELLDDASFPLAGDLRPDQWYVLGRQRLVFLGEPKGDLRQILATSPEIGWLPDGN